MDDTLPQTDLIVWWHSAVTGHGIIRRLHRRVRRATNRHRRRRSHRHADDHRGGRGSADVRTPRAIGGWEGIAPSSIEGDTNPTLTLQEGETYKLGWTEGDGFGHNIAIRDGDGNVVGDLQTQRTTDPGDGQWLTFTASSEMAAYVYEPHQSTMVGNIEVV